MEPSVREARLKPEYADLYPPLSPSAWTAAAEIGAKLLFWHIKSIGALPSGERLLNNEHFEFRGGWNRGTGDHRTRVTDEEDSPAQM